MQSINSQSSIEIVQGQRGAGKTNSLKTKMVDNVPLYIVDIRNEWKHLPSFDSAQKFTYFLMGNRDRRFVRYPSNNKYYKEGQFRFNFSSKNELLTLFTYMRHFRNCTIIVD